MKYKVYLEIDADEDRNVELAIDSALSEYGIHVLELNAYRDDD